MRDLEAVVLQLKLLAGARNPSATGESMRPNEARPLTPLAISPEIKMGRPVCGLDVGAFGLDWCCLLPALDELNLRGLD
jgi:hypothetical protein